MEFLLKCIVVFAFCCTGVVFFIWQWSRLYKEVGKDCVLKGLFLELLFVFFSCLVFLFPFINVVWSGVSALRTINGFDILIYPFISTFLLTILAPKKISYKVLLAIHLPFVLLLLAGMIVPGNVVILVCEVLFVVFSAILVLAVSSKRRNYDRNNYSRSYSSSIKRVRAGVLLLSAFLLFRGYTVLFETKETLINYSFLIIALWVVLIVYIRSYKALEVLPGEFTLSRQNPEEADDGMQFAFGERLYAYVEDNKAHLNPNFSISDLSEGFGISRIYLLAYFKNILATNFYEYINSFRINHACKLLAETEINMGDVPALCGFDSWVDFKRSFLEYKQCSPEKYRRMNSDLPLA